VIAVSRAEDSQSAEDAVLQDAAALFEQRAPGGAFVGDDLGDDLLLELVQDGALGLAEGGLVGKSGRTAAASEPSP